MQLCYTLPHIEANNVTGTIPFELSFLSNMEFLVLSLNEISGTIPPSIGDMALLKELLIDRCPWLSGVIPNSLGNLQSLEFVSLWNNNLSGTLPESLTRLPNLKVLQLANNYLSGTIPEFSERGPLERISIGYNLFEGTLPNSIYQLSSLEKLDVDEGYLTGTISSKISNLMNKLESLWLCCNEFVGSLPTQMGELRRLTSLDVSRNKLTGSIPTELGNLFRSKPVIDDGLVFNGLWLDHNMFSGTLPSELGSMMELGGMDVGWNHLSGQIPTELGLLSTLRENYIGFGHNDFTGSLDGIFCNEQPFQPVFLIADCDEVQCSCCTDCCSQSSSNQTSNDGYNETQQCIVNVPVVCENIAFQISHVENPSTWGTTCQCSSSGSGSNTGGETSTESAIIDAVTTDVIIDDEFINLSCADTGCVSCDLDSTSCVENVDYGYDLPVDTGFDNLYYCTMKYVNGPASSNGYKLVTHRVDFSSFECSISIDGTECNSCLLDRRCNDDFDGIRVDCSNIEDGAIYDDCDPTLDGGEILKFFNQEYFEQDCMPCTAT